MANITLPIPMFRLGQYAYSTSQIHFFEKGTVVSNGPILHLDMVVVAAARAAINLVVIDHGIEFTSSVTASKSEGITRRDIIDACRASIRECYIDRDSSPDKRPLPPLKSMLGETISIDDNTGLITAKISVMPDFTRLKSIDS